MMGDQAERAGCERREARVVDLDPIDEAERERRERESLETVREYFAEPHPEGPDQHPSVRE